MLLVIISSKPMIQILVISLIVFPDTINNISSTDPSVHLTVGVDSLIWSLTYEGLRKLAYKRSGIQDKLVLAKVPNDLYWEFQVLVCPATTEVFF